MTFRYVWTSLPLTLDNRTVDTISGVERGSGMARTVARTEIGENSTLCGNQRPWEGACELFEKFHPCLA